MIPRTNLIVHIGLRWGDLELDKPDFCLLYFLHVSRGFFLENETLDQFGVLLCERIVSKTRCERMDKSISISSCLGPLHTRHFYSRYCNKKMCDKKIFLAIDV
jgi:hypothetical protein